MLYKLFNALRAWLRPAQAPATDGDVLARLSPGEWADLPPYHPQSECCEA